ncbi:MAG: DMT family transporter [Rhodobacteraceae bacterium]|nr:DMT family transporter [Paracoccaceae bacterium]
MSKTPSKDWRAGAFAQQTVPDGQPKTRNLRGIILMVLAMLGFAISDGFVKALTEVMPNGQLLIFFGLTGSTLVAIYAKLRRIPLTGSFLINPIFVIRWAADMFAAICIVGSFALAPLSLVAAILQVSPLFAAALAALLLGESLGPRRLFAIAVGLFGVLIITEPWNAGLEIGALLAAGGAFLLALRDVLTRMAPRDIPSEALVAYGISAMAFAGALSWIISPAWAPLELESVWLLAGGVLTGIAGYTLITSASRSAEITAIAPFRYSRLVFALLIGALFFGETLSSWALLGSTLVIGSGLFVFWREARLAAQTKATP